MEGNKFQPTPLNTTPEKIQKILTEGREMPNDKDCFVNALELGNIISSEIAGLIRLFMSNDQSPGVSQVFANVMLNYISYKLYHDSDLFRSFIYFNKYCEILCDHYLLVLKNNPGLGFIFWHHKTGVEFAHWFIIYSWDSNLYLLDSQLTPPKNKLPQLLDDSVYKDYFQGVSEYGILCHANGDPETTFYKPLNNIIGLGDSENFFRRVTLKDTNSKHIIEVNTHIFDSKFDNALSILNTNKDKISDGLRKCFNIPNPEEYLWSHLQSNDQTKLCILLDEDNEPITYCMILDNNTYYFIHSVCTLPDKRGQGGCKTLIKYISDVYRDKPLILEVSMNNFVAQRCYSQIGFIFQPIQQGEVLEPSGGLGKMLFRGNETEFSKIHNYITGNKVYTIYNNEFFYVSY